MEKEKIRALKDSTTRIMTRIRHQSCKTYCYTLLIIAVLGMFTFITQPLQRVDAVQFLNISTGGFHAVTAGSGSYASNNNSWYFLSDQNVTIFRIVDNTTSVAQSAVLSTGINTCTDPASVKVIDSITGSKKYIAVLCRNGVSQSTLEVRTTQNLGIREDIETGFSGFDDELFRLVEWKSGAKLFALDLTSGSGFNFYMFDLTKINSTTTSMFQNRFNYGTECQQATINGVVVETASELWLSCRDGIAGTHFLVVDLNTMTQKADGGLSLADSLAFGIDYNPSTDDIILTTSIGGIWNIDRATKNAVALTSIVCSEMADIAMNPNTNRIYAICKSDDTIREYSIFQSKEIASFGINDFGTNLMGGQNNYATIDGRISGSATNFWVGYGFEGIGAGAGLRNYVTNIIEPSLILDGGTAQVCIDVNPLPDFTTLQCFTDQNGDGIPDQQPNTPISPFNATFSGYTIGCQIGLIDCTNPNPQTNGVGYFYLLFLIIGFIGLMGYLTTWKLNDVHIMIWILGLVVCTGIAFFLKWTDGIPFFFSIVAVLAFGGVKVAESLRS